MPYDGKYGKVASAMKKKRAHNKYGSPDNSRRKFHKFSDGGGSQKVPPNTGVPSYKHGDSTTGADQDGRKGRPPMSQARSMSKGKRHAHARTDSGPYGAKTPMPKRQEGHPVKRDATEKATGFRSFQSIIKGNVMGRRPPKKLAKANRPASGGRGTSS